MKGIGEIARERERESKTETGRERGRQGKKERRGQMMKEREER